MAGRNLGLPCPARVWLAHSANGIAATHPPTVLQGVELLAHGAGGKIERVKAEDALNGKTVGIYFSAHW